MQYTHAIKDAMQLHPEVIMFPLFRELSPFALKSFIADLLETSPSQVIIKREDETIGTKTIKAIKAAGFNTTVLLFDEMELAEIERSSYLTSELH